MDNAKDLNALKEVLLDAVFEIEAALMDAPGDVELEEWTDQEISEMVSTNPYLYEDNPDQFARMKPYANPDYKPFKDAGEWHRFVVGGCKESSRQLVDVEEDGIVYRRVRGNKHSPDWHLIAQGVRDVTEDIYHYAGERIVSLDEQLDRIRSYDGELRDPVSKWPPIYREAYEEVRS